jgi:hypothetical protein
VGGSYQSKGENNEQQTEIAGKLFDPDCIHFERMW